MARVKKEDRPPMEPLRPMLTQEARESRLIALASDLAEKQLREGTASSQVITHYLKLGTEKYRLEREIMEKQKDLIDAKTVAINSTARMEELYANAIEAMRRYSPTPIEEEDLPDDY